MAPEFIYFFVPSLIIFNISILPFYNNITITKTGINIRNRNIWLLYIKLGLLLFCIFGAYGGDWFSYREEIDYLNSFSRMPEQRHLESIYIWIIEYITHNNYILFRILIWSTSFYCLSNAFIRLNIDTISTWSCFAVLSIAVSYAIGRGAIGFSLILWGYSFLLRPGINKILSYTKGTILLILSLFCHKSMFLLAPLIYLSFINFNIKRTILCVIITIPIIGIVQHYILLRLAMGEEITGSDYFTSEQNTYGIGMNIWRYSYYFIIISLFAYAYYRIIICKQHVPQYVYRCLNLIILLFIEYLILFFAFTYQNIGSDDLAWRVFAMINIPLPIIISYFLSNIAPKYILYIFNYALLISNYFIIYNAYTNYF